MELLLMMKSLNMLRKIKNQHQRIGGGHHFIAQSSLTK